jgi:hypothetical protein
MNDGVSISEFAREIGISRTMVQKLLKSGTLPQYMNGTIPLEAGLKAYEEYKAAPKSKGGRPPKSAVVKATKQESSKPLPDKIINFNEAKAKQESRPPRPDIPNIEDTPDVPINDKAARAKEAVSINAAMNKAKLAEKTYQARLRELDYKTKSGELLEKSEVEAEAQWLAEQVKAKLMAIPPRISSMCEGRIAREIEEIITDAINNALKELQKCKYTGDQE